MKREGGVGVKLVLSLIMNALLLVTAYFGTIKSHNGAKNVLLFFVWFQLIIYLMVSAAKHKLEGCITPTLPGAVRVLVDFTVVIMMAYAGWFVSSGAHAMAMLMEAHILSSTRVSHKEQGE